MLRALVMVSGKILEQGAVRRPAIRHAIGKATTGGDPLPGPQFFIGPLSAMYWNTNRMYR